MPYVPTAPNAPNALAPTGLPLMRQPPRESAPNAAPAGRLPPAHQAGPGAEDITVGRREVEPGVRHLTVVHGFTTHDIVVDPVVQWGAVLATVLGDAPPTLRWVATTLTGQVLVDGDSIERAGLVDGSVMVAIPLTGTDLGAPAPRPASATDTTRTHRTSRTSRTSRTPRDTDDPVEAGDSGDGEERSRSGGRPTDGVTVGVAACCGLALSVFALWHAVLPGVGVPRGGGAVLALALAATISRVVPDLVLRMPAEGASVNAAVHDRSGHDTPSVRAWVGLVAGRQTAAHLAVLLVVLAAAGALLAARPGMPLSSPVLMSLVASAMALAGNARGRGRNDRWVLSAASTAALVPVLSVVVAMSSTSSAVVAAYGFVGLGLVAIRPGRGVRRPGLARSRLARDLDVLIVIAALPLACWASGLLHAVQVWESAVLS